MPIIVYQAQCCYLAICLGVREILHGEKKVSWNLNAWTYSYCDSFKQICLSVFWAHTNNVIKLFPWYFTDTLIIPRTVCWCNNVAFHLYLFLPLTKKDFSNTACTSQESAPKHYWVFLDWGCPITSSQRLLASISQTYLVNVVCIW